MQSVSSRIWTRVAVFISYDDNDYTTGTSFFNVIGAMSWKQLALKSLVTAKLPTQFLLGFFF